MDMHLHIAWELKGLPRCIIKDSVLRRKHLLATGGVVKVVAALKHVLAVGVHVPVPQVRGCVHVHVTVGDEAHVGVAGPDGGEECNVVLYIPRLATVLHSQVTICPQQGLIQSCLLNVVVHVDKFNTHNYVLETCPCTKPWL